MKNMGSRYAGLSRRVLLALMMLAMLSLYAGCKDRGPYPLELTPMLTQVLGLDFKTLPDEGLVDQAGEAFSFESFLADGKPVMMTEIYTNCPMPDMCPMLMSKMSRAQKLIEADGVKSDDFRVLILSMDPENDSPEAMLRYAEAHDLKMDNVTLVTGNKASLDAIMKALEVGIRMAPDGELMHSMRTYVVGADGKVTAGFRQSGWQPEELATRLREQL